MADKVDIYHPETGGTGRVSPKALRSLKEKGWVEGTAETAAVKAAPRPTPPAPPAPDAA